MIQIKEELLSLGRPETVSKLLALMGISLDDFKDNVRSASVMEVMEFLKTVPDPEFYVLKAVGNKQVDKVEYMRQYIDLQKRLAAKQEEVRSLVDKQKEVEDIQGIIEQYES